VGVIRIGLVTRDGFQLIAAVAPQHRYPTYYHEDRTHLGLAKDTPASRPTEIRSARERKIHSFPRLGGLHHRYAAAAWIQELFF
jgi:hypothetical protein